MTTLPLRKHLDKWASREDNRSRVVCLQKLLTLVPILMELCSFFWKYLERHRKWRLSPPQNVILSILILGETLKNASIFVWRLPPENSPLPPLGLVYRDNPIKERFTQIGCCLNEVTMLTDMMDYIGLYIASMLKRPFNNGQRSHSTCTAQQCNANQVNESSYETKQTKGCLNPADCPYIFADDQEVSAILQQGQIPVIKILYSPVDKNEVELRVIPSSSPYVAISHVWAHGLGNPTTNSLPRCQIQRLDSLTQELFSPMSRFVLPALWIDTLCISVHESLRDKRKLAISRMAETYGKADQVLIIDRDLMQASRNCSRTETATRVLCSDWMRRLWTLQEAVLTDNRPNCKKLRI